MNTCNICGNKLLLLFSSYYCPNDCDKSSNNDNNDIWYCIAQYLNIDPTSIEKQGYLCIKDFEQAKQYILKATPNNLLFKIKVSEIKGSEMKMFGNKLIKDADAHYCTGKVLEKIQIRHP